MNLQPSPSPLGVTCPSPRLLAPWGAAEYIPPHDNLGGGLTMKGAIRARGTCDRCGGKWRDEYARGRQVAVVCEKCGTGAPAVYVDARGFKDSTGNVDRIYTDEQEQLLTFPAASRLLEAIRTALAVLGGRR